MENRTFPIAHKNSPFDKSTESIESKKRVKGPSYNGDIFSSLDNEMQQSDGKQDFSDRI